MLTIGHIRVDRPLPQWVWPIVGSIYNVDTESLSPQDWTHSWLHKARARPLPARYDGSIRANACDGGDYVVGYDASAVYYLNLIELEFYVLHVSLP